MYVLALILEYIRVISIIHIYCFYIIYLITHIVHIFIIVNDVYLTYIYDLCKDHNIYVQENNILNNIYT